jgi:hypothetical protein
MFSKTKTEYMLNVSLWISATANANAPLLGELIEENEVKLITNEIPEPSLKVNKISTRIINLENVGNKLIAEYEYISATNCYVTIELQQKEGIAYKSISNRLNQVNDSTIHNMGVFNIECKDGNNQVNLKLSSATEESTYRILFRVYNENNIQLLQVPYNFLVIE